MLDKLKQMRDMQKQAKEIQKTLANEEIVSQSGSIEIKMNGNMEVQSVKIIDSVDNEKMEKDIKNTINDAVKKSQRVMAQKMMGGGMNIPGL